MKSNKSRLAALLLALFLGAFGGHRFYAGKVGTAILMILLTLTGVGALFTAVWVISDIIEICRGRWRDGNGRRIADWNPVQED